MVESGAFAARYQGVVAQGVEGDQHQPHRPWIAMTGRRTAPVAATQAAKGKEGGEPVLRPGAEGRGRETQLRDRG